MIGVHITEPVWSTRCIEVKWHVPILNCWSQLSYCVYILHSLKPPNEPTHLLVKLLCQTKQTDISDQWRRSPTTSHQHTQCYWTIQFSMKLLRRTKVWSHVHRMCHLCFNMKVNMIVLLNITLLCFSTSVSHFSWTHGPLYLKTAHLKNVGQLVFQKL